MVALIKPVYFPLKDQCCISCVICASYSLSIYHRRNANVDTNLKSDLWAHVSYWLFFFVSSFFFLSSFFLSCEMKASKSNFLLFNILLKTTIGLIRSNDLKKQVCVCCFRCSRQNDKSTLFVMRLAQYNN